MRLTKLAHNQKYDVISVSHYFYPRVGGLEKMAYQVLKGLTDAGLTTLAVYNGQKDAFFKQNGISHRVYKSRAIFSGKYPLVGLGYIIKLARLLARQPQATILIYDRHFVTSLLAALVTKALGRKFTLVSQTTASYYFNSKLVSVIAQFTDKYLFGLVVKLADQIVAVSEANKSYLVNRFHINSRKVRVIYNGYDQRNFQLDTQKLKQNNVVFAAKWIPVKDPATVLQAFTALAQKHIDWHFWLIGEGDLELPAVSLPNLHVVSKFFTAAELAELFAVSKVYVNASIEEGLSLAVLEALATGTITVLSDAPSNAELAWKFNLLDSTFTRRSAVELAQKVELAMNDWNEHASETLAEQAKSFAQERAIIHYRTLLTNATSRKELTVRQSNYLFNLAE